MQAPVTGLVERARMGDQEAFAELVRAGSNRLYALAYRILRDADRAEDALQTALIAIWDDLPALRDVERYEAWSYRIVCRACYREARRERRQTLGRWLPSFPGPEGHDPMTELDDRDEMERGFAHLSLEHRAVLVLHYYLGLTIGETAAVLGASPGTVGSRLHYALRGLQAALAAEARVAPAWKRST